MPRRVMLAIAAAAAVTASLPGVAAQGSSLRGLRAPGVIDFSPLDAPHAGMPTPPATAGEPSAPQPSPLYGLRERAPGAGTAVSDPARLSYSYSPSLTGILEAGPAQQDPYSTGYALSGQLVRSFGSGLGLGLGLRQRLAGSNVLALGVRQGWGPFSGGYTLYSGRADEASPSHRFALKFSYGNRSSIGLSYSAGRDLQAGVLPYTPGVDSRDWKLSGHHWLAPQWALTYDLVNSEQAAYRRQGLRFGIRHTF